MTIELETTNVVETPASLRIVLAQEIEPLAIHARRWNELAGDVPFRTWEWAESWWHHYREQYNRLFVPLVFDEQGTLVGIAPWHVRRSSREGTAVRFLGSGEVCSDYLSILCEPDSAADVGRALGDWLSRESPVAWNLLDLNGVAQGDRAIENLVERLEQNGHAVDRASNISCWRTALPNNWDTFLAQLSKSRRERTRALLRRAFDAGRATLHAVQSPEDLALAMAILIELHQKRRRSLSQQGCFSSARFTGFHREIAARFLASGRLRLLWTELDGRPVAAEYSFTGGDTVFYYQGGFEPELADERPGWLGFAASLKLAIEQGFANFDFLRGDESYKASWRAAAQPIVRYRVAGRQASSRVRFATWRACEGVKQWARLVLPTKKG